MKKRAKKNNSLNSIKSDLQKVNTTISNIMLAIENGIYTETTKPKLEELKIQRKDPRLL